MKKTMRIEGSDGTIKEVPFRDVESEGVIKSYWLDYDEYDKFPEVFVQRNTEARLGRRRKQLSKFMEEHVVVHVAKLTQDDVVKGKEFKAGTIFREDSNTRALLWRQGGSDYIPSRLKVIEYSFPTMERIRKSYETFDSPDATERNQERLWGILQGIYRFEPQSPKIIRGQILTALNKACNFYFPDQYPHWGNADLVGQVGCFLEEIKHLDKYIKNASNWDQALVTGGLMIIRRYGLECDKVNSALKQIDERKYDNMSPNRDGISHICYEWEVGKFFDQKVTSWDKDCGLNNCVSFILYWFDKYYSNEKGLKPGNNWKTYGKNYKDMFQPADQVSLLNKVFEIKSS